MRTSILFFGFAIFLTLLGTPANAQTSATSSSRELPVATSSPRESGIGNASSSLADRIASSTERREERQEIRSTRQAVLSAERQQRVLNLSANLSNRFEAAINRFYAIITRLEARTNKLKESGINTDLAEAEIRIATQHLADARATLNTIDTMVNEATTSTEPQNRWVSVRATYQKAGVSIRAAHQSLQKSISLLKSSTAVVPASTEPSVVATTTTNE